MPTRPRYPRDLTISYVVVTQLGVQHVFTSPYHLQTNGLTECLNKTLKQEIITYIDPCHRTWDQSLPFITHAYNTYVQVSTRINPFRALYGRDPWLPPESSIDVHSKPTNMNSATWGALSPTNDPPPSTSQLQKPTSCIATLEVALQPGSNYPDLC